LNNEEDGKKNDKDDKGVELPTINGKRTQYFDLDDFNSDDKGAGGKSGKNQNKRGSLDVTTPASK